MTRRARLLAGVAVVITATGAALVYVGARGHGSPGFERHNVDLPATSFEEHLPRPSGSTLPSTGVSSPADLARVLCRAAAPTPLFSSRATTVGDFRDTTTGGTRAPSQDTLYPSFRADSFGAWCWTGRGPYDVYEVTADGKAHLIANHAVVPASEARGAPPRVP